MVAVLWIAMSPAWGEACRFDVYGKTVREIRIEKSDPDQALDEGSIRGVLLVHPGQELSLQSLQNSLRLLYALDRFKGIEVVTEPVGPGEVDLIFIFDQRPIFRRVKFSGGFEILPWLIPRGGVTLKSLRRAVPVSYGTAYRETLVDESKAAIRNLYRRQGFFENSVQTEMRVRDDAFLDITFETDLGEPTILERVYFRGIEDFPDHEPRDKMRNKVGKRFVLERLDDDVQRLERTLGDRPTAWDEFVGRVYRPKNTFTTAEVDVEEIFYDNDTNAVEGTFQLRGGTDVTVNIDRRGRLWHWTRRVNGESLLYELPVMRQFKVDEDLIADGASILEDIYADRNYYDSQVSYTVETPASNEKVITYTIDEGRRVKVERFVTKGNEELSDDSLESTILSGRGLGKNRFFNPQVYRSDAAAIETYYRERGWMDVNVIMYEPVFTSPTSVDLQVSIIEGKRYYARSIDIRSNGLELPALQLNLEPGDYLQRKLIRPDLENLVEYYLKRGVRDVRAEAEYLDTNITHAKDVVYVLENPEVYRVGEIVIRGLGRTRRSVVERELTFRTGDTYRYEDLLESQQELYELGLFQRVSFSAIPRPYDPRVLDVLVELQEGRAGLVEFGFGFFEESGFSELLSITYGNIGGRDRSINLFIEHNELEDRQELTFREPYLFTSKFQLAWTLFRGRVREPNYTADIYGSSVSFLREIGDYWRFLIGSSTSRVSLGDQEEIPEELRIDNVTVLRSQVFYDDRDNKLNPKRGNLIGLEVQVSPRFLADPFWKSELQGAFYLNVREQHVLVFSQRLGWGDRLPITERFEVGTRILRGFEKEDIGPFAVNDAGTAASYVGGNVYFASNLEFRYALYSWLGLAVFFDVGGAFADADAIYDEDIRSNTGAGIILQTPVGPVRLDYGVKIDRRHGESFGEFSFSLGHLF